MVKVELDCPTCKGVQVYNMEKVRTEHKDTYAMRRLVREKHFVWNIVMKAPGPERTKES